MGSQLMPLAQLAYNDNKTKNLKFGFFYDHLSAKGFTIRNQRFSDDMPGAYLRYFPKNLKWCFIYLPQLPDTFLWYRQRSLEPEARQLFRTYDGQVYFKNAQPNDLKLDVKQTLDFNYFHEG